MERYLNKLIRLMLYTNNPKDENYLKMDWDERTLLSLNLDYLWK